jgi:hypothetical protein
MLDRVVLTIPTPPNLCSNEVFGLQIAVADLTAPARDTHNL